MKTVRWILGLVGLMVLVGFWIGVYHAAYYTLWVSGAPRPDLMPAVASTFVIAVNGLLATHLGAYLGVTFALANWRPPLPIGWLQIVAAIMYVIALLWASAAWWRAGWTDDPTRVVSLLPLLGRTGMGIGIAILGAALGVQNATIRYTLLGAPERKPPDPV